MLLAVLVAFLAAGCNPQPLPVAPTAIPVLPPATLPPVTAEPPDSGGGEMEPTPETGGGELVEAGSVIYEANCALCHSVTAEARIGPGLAGLFERETLPNGSAFNEENLREWIVVGGGAMPGIPLADEELDALVAFLQEATQE